MTPWRTSFAVLIFSIGFVDTSSAAVFAHTKFVDTSGPTNVFGGCVSAWSGVAGEVAAYNVNCSMRPWRIMLSWR